MKKYLCIITIFPLLFIFLMECASSKETLVYIVTWESDVRITNSGDNSILPTLGTSNGTLHLAWADARDGVENREVYYNRSTDNGTTWQSTDVRISHDPAYSIKPDFTANGDTVNLFWRDNRDGNYEIYMVHSEDDGISWGPETKITQDPGYSGCPFLASHGNTLHLFWRDNRLGTFKIYYKRSTDAGHTWGSDILLTPDGIMAEFPFIALNGDTLHLVWRDKRNGDPDIYYKRSIDGGNNWTEDIRLTDNTSESEHPKISVQNNNIFVTWRDDRDGSYNVYYKTSTDNGMTWSSDTKLKENPGNSYWPVMVVSNNILHLLWCNDRDGTTALYYTFSTDYGSTWNKAAKLSECVGYVMINKVPYYAMGAHTILAVDSHIHIVFYDDRTGVNEIYYKRGIISSQKDINIAATSGLSHRIGIEK